MSACEGGTLREFMTFSFKFSCERSAAMSSTEKACVICCCWWWCVSPRSRTRAQTLTYSVRGISSDGKNEFEPNSPSLKKGFFVCEQSLLRLQITTPFQKVMKGPQRGIMCKSYWLSLLGNKQKPKLHISTSSTKTAFQK